MSSIINSVKQHLSPKHSSSSTLNNKQQPQQLKTSTDSSNTATQHSSTSTMSFPYKHILLIGATAGIGAAIADEFVAEGLKVTAVGRRAERLDAFVSKHGKDKASGFTFDITNTAGVPDFVRSVTAAHPDIDLVMFNAGVQNPLKLNDPSAWNAQKFHSEVATNFTSFVDLSQAFLPFFQAKKSPSAFLFVGSHLGFVPAAGLPAYSSSKAALGAYVICLREQLHDSSIKVIDLWPPVVQTELHDYMGSEKGRAMGMPVDQFVKLSWAELQAGHEAIIIGEGPAPKDEFNALVYKRNEFASKLAAKMRGAH